MALLRREAAAEEEGGGASRQAVSPPAPGFSPLEDDDESAAPAAAAAAPAAAPAPAALAGDSISSSAIAPAAAAAAAGGCKHQPFVIGVAGGTASGKTTVCDLIIQQLHDHRVVLVNQDSFYRGLTAAESQNPNEYNFDHPDAFDTDELVECVRRLKGGGGADTVQIPVYDFTRHRRRTDAVRHVNAADVVILEGILIFADARLRGLMDMKIFVDTDADTRLGRRVRRDTLERGRDVRGVLAQYAKFVKPAFEDFVLPTKKYADVIVPRGAENRVAVHLIVQHIQGKLLRGAVRDNDVRNVYPGAVHVIRSTFQTRGMHTIIRDAGTRNPDFVFYADRLIRLVVEHGLGHLPFTQREVTTPTGCGYAGVDFCRRLCGVSIIRSGESMENALRTCCNGIKIGKILIHRRDRGHGHGGGGGKHLVYHNLPGDIQRRHVLLLDPVLATGNCAVQAIELLMSKGVPEAHIIFLNLISAPEGIHAVCQRFPRLKIVTSEIDGGLNDEFRVVPGLGEFGDRYFGTDDDDDQPSPPPAKVSSSSSSPPDPSLQQQQFTGGTSANANANANGGGGRHTAEDD